MITGKLYEWLKWAAQVVLPALGTLYFTIAGIWDISGADKVVGTVMALDLFLGVLLGISQINYNKQVVDGVMNVDETGDKISHTLELDGEAIDEIPDSKEVRLKVKKRG